MKGLSPVVATIILIAFAVAIGGLVSLWLSNFTTSTTEFTSEQGDKLTACAAVRIKFDRVTDFTVIYSNPSTKPITNVTIYDSSGRNITVIGNITLQSGQVGNFTWARGANESIFMRGVCEDNIVVEGQCERGQVCWK